MIRTITKNDIEMMIYGSSIYSTGGGIEYSTQKNLFNKLLNQNVKLSLLSIDELSDSEYICTAYAAGSAGNTNFDLSHQLRLGMKALEEYMNKRFVAVFSGETNTDILTFQTAVSAGLPVLDADSNGGRSVPEIQLDNFTITDNPITPLVAITPDNQITIMKHSQNPYDIEKFVRKLSAKYDKGLIAVIDHPISIKEAKKALTLGTFERSINLGEYILANRKNPDMVEGILKKTSGKLLFSGIITNIEVDHDSHEGFLTGYYFVEDQKGNVLNVFIKNENIICWINEKLLLTAPDSILTIDLETFLGIHNSKLKAGQRVMVVGKKASDLWRGKIGKELFSPRHFGFKFNNKLLP